MYPSSFIWPLNKAHPFSLNSVFFPLCHAASPKSYPHFTDKAQMMRLRQVKLKYVVIQLVDDSALIRTWGYWPQGIPFHSTFLLIIFLQWIPEFESQLIGFQSSGISFRTTSYTFNHQPGFTILFLQWVFPGSHSR